MRAHTCVRVSVEMGDRRGGGGPFRVDQHRGEWGGGGGWALGGEGALIGLLEPGGEREGAGGCGLQVTRSHHSFTFESAGRGSRNRKDFL